ncbi:flagellar basal body-associated FliL family protein [Paenibacillus thailandensis]|uniref:Flagellar protein FliL n=1 Tax=Paenibacillus thailandensis TaxID=393250 RepID=A0ABW5QY28_9BACL
MKKMLPWMITILLAVSLIAVVSVILFNVITEKPEDGKESEQVEVQKLSADQLVAVSSELKDFMRNLKNPEYVVQLDLAFQLDSKKTKEEFDKLLEIEVKPVINRAVADMTEDDLKGSQGEDALEAKLLSLINPVLPEGKLIKVEITKILISEI